MADLQQTRWDKLLRRTANIVGEGAIVTNTLQEVFPVFDLENPPSELLILGGTRMAFGGGGQSAVAAQAGRYQIFNPANSGHIITVTGFFFSIGGLSILRYGIVNQAIATVGTQRFADTRGVFTALPVGQINEVTSIALAPATGQFLLLGNVVGSLYSDKGIFVLAPGTGLEVGSSLINTASSCTFHWREREATDSELDL